MGTMFFHESHFQGLLERVRERGRTNLAQRVADQVHRLFTQNAGKYFMLLFSLNILSNYFLYFCKNGKNAVLFLIR